MYNGQPLLAFTAEQDPRAKLSENVALLYALPDNAKLRKTYRPDKSRKQVRLQKVSQPLDEGMDLVLLVNFF